MYRVRVRLRDGTPELQRLDFFGLFWSRNLRLRRDGRRMFSKEVVMVRVRLEGLPEEVHRISDAMQAAGCVLERSREYPNRGESRYVRVYLDCDLPEGCEVNRHD